MIVRLAEQKLKITKCPRCEDMLKIVKAENKSPKA